MKELKRHQRKRILSNRKIALRKYFKYLVFVLAAGLWNLHLFFGKRFNW
ncbi:hypothetical protein LEP1GSC062_2522 [Leptospira alexanderi serovar Manhao 3 str. L 60]|uniref:Uncharacterized protein n=1 Tax=Leptospira alexanderi serovar Manhao 3 str. L 60 TaxID=1049759 RepID=V6I066_9LEPT|nr:hypothetical protein LEP1GSC062_2522 [Leptospira alexanderi serovar Manhao 3 str. L 60]